MNFNRFIFNGFYCIQYFSVTEWIHLSEYSILTDLKSAFVPKIPTFPIEFLFCFSTTRVGVPESFINAFTCFSSMISVSLNHSSAFGGFAIPFS